MQKIVLANWKAQLSPNQVDDWLQDFGRKYTPADSIQVALAIPFLYMERVAAAVTELPQVSIAAQGVSPYPPGSYTGATPASWLGKLCRYALIGHQERRHYFHEDTQTIAAQVREAADAGLKPIICLNKDNYHPVFAALDSDDIADAFPAYTPSDSVSLEIAAIGKEIINIAASLAASSNGRPVLYGGGVNKKNAAELINLKGISGIMVGRSCLDGGEFAELVNSVG